jgi:hypothetical protein
VSASEKSTPDLLEALAAADAFDTFCRLPTADQENFSHWIERARDDESRSRRISALVLAVRIAPLQAAESSVARPDAEVARHRA